MRRRNSPLCLFINPLLFNKMTNNKKKRIKTRIFEGILVGSSNFKKTILSKTKIIECIFCEKYNSLKNS